MNTTSKLGAHTHTTHYTRSLSRSPVGAKKE
jgi:hypothetical protein